MLFLGRGSIFFLLLCYARMPQPLLGRDIFQKVGAHLVENPFPHILLLLSNKETSLSEKPKWLASVNPEVLATEIPGLAKYATPVKSQLKNPSRYPQQ